MNNAIKISLKKAKNNYDLLASKLFGAPVIPDGWLDGFSDGVIFFGQIRLSDIAELDTENKLPHTGYLYLFLDTEVYPYAALAKYYDGEPRTVVDDFNCIEDRFSRLNKAFLMEFSPCEEDYDGTKLFGTPSFDYGGEGELLLQFDPLDNETGFLDDVDGYAYFIFGEDGDRLKGVKFVIDRS